MLFSGGGGEGKSTVDCRLWPTLFCKANGKLARFSLPGLGGAGGPENRSLDGEPEEKAGAEEAALGLNLLTKFWRDSWYADKELALALELR